MYDKSVLHLVKDGDALALCGDIRAAYKYASEKIAELRAKLVELEYNRAELTKDYERLGRNIRELENIKLDTEVYF